LTLIGIRCREEEGMGDTSLLRREASLNSRRDRESKTTQKGMSKEVQGNIPETSLLLNRSTVVLQKPFMGLGRIQGIEDSLCVPT
jgi:hypothetical protein